MPEPVNPSDHSIQIGDGTSIQPSDAWRFSEMGQAHGLALAEAIHQTFERDAESVKRWNTTAEASEALGESIMPFDAWAFSKRIPDPDTEIDRLARLIVDGEYRRRAEQEQTQ